MTLNSEDELWACVGTGDGMHCSLYSDCNFRKSGGWCVDDNLKYIENLRGQAEQLSDKILATGNYDLRLSSQCQIIKLLECLAQSFLQKGGISCVPVPTSLAMLADEPDSIEVRLVPLTTAHGGLWRLERKWIVQLNSNDKPTRRRFTLFHEIFHILAHRKTTPVFSRLGYEGAAFNEWMADYFAACVLAPPHLVEKEWPKFKDILQMRRHFDVPFGIIIFMLKRVGLAVLFGLLTLLTSVTEFC
jgi:Zn-dependent peptidase ImmA (M78 family)